MTVRTIARRTTMALALAWAGAVLMACAAPQSPPPAPTALTPEQRCVAEGNTWDVGNARMGGHCAKGGPVQCEATGGRWQRVCMLGTLACVKPYADAGKACQSGRDCQGRRCLMKAGASPQVVPQTGQCIANDNLCHFGINLENGHAVPTAVAD